MAIVGCKEKMRLMMAYQEATAAHSEAVSKLVVMGIPADQYQRLSAAAEQARKAAQEARGELERHIAGHGC